MGNFGYASIEVCQNNTLFLFFLLFNCADFLFSKSFSEIGRGVSALGIIITVVRDRGSEGV